MVDVQTALGPVPSDQLGLTYGHEHLFVTSAGVREFYPWLFDTAAELDHTTAELIAELNGKQPGDRVTLTVVRGGETIDVQVTLGEWPQETRVLERRRTLPDRGSGERGPFSERFHFRLPDRDGLQGHIPEDLLDRLFCRDRGGGGKSLENCRGPFRK